eukprot:796789-Prymnesium_polylepis.2
MTTHLLPWLCTQVKSSVFPVNRWGTECSKEDLIDKPCSCYGGAPRRKKFLALASEGGDVVTLDLGEHFGGSGLFFPTFRGNITGSFFEEVGYDAVGLGYTDLASFKDSSDPTGMVPLARFFQRFIGRQGVVSTSLNVSDTPCALPQHCTRLQAAFMYI